MALFGLLLAALSGCDSSTTEPDAHDGDGAAQDGNEADGLDAGEADADGTSGDGAPSDGGGSSEGDAGGELPVPSCVPASAGNPIVEGWYADPDMKIYDGVYWLYPTYSAPYEQQTFLDAFSSTDLIHWQKHERVLERANVSWANRAVWAPSPIQHNGKYYLFFGANDIQDDTQLGGIGVAVADGPGGPYVDAIGRPLIDAFHNGAQPIDQNVFVDDDGQAYLYYGGWHHCNVVKLSDDLTRTQNFDDGSTFKEITPTGYTEGALMFKRNGTYYFMWSEGGWTGPDYRVSYAMADSPLGPFDTRGTILGQNAAVATGAGHNTVVNVPGSDDWYIFYHRRPLGETDGNHRVLAYDRLRFHDDGTIAPVQMSTRDDFCDDNAIGWSTSGGRFEVQDKGLVVASSGESKAWMNTNWSALRYGASVTVGSAGHAGVLFRVSDVGAGEHGYRGYYAGVSAAEGRAFLGRADAGSWQELASDIRPLAAGVPHQLEVVATGSALTLWVDGLLAVSVHDDAYASGKTGLLTTNASARFDDIDVTPPEGAVFYQDGSFGGLAVSLPPGDYLLPQMEAAGLPNDWVSSLRVPDGYVVEVFADNDFGGASWTFTSDTALLPAEANDQMSSVKISAP